MRESACLSASAGFRRLLLLAFIATAGITGCSGEDPMPPVPANEKPAGLEPSDAVLTLTSVQTAQWSRSCALCHVRGEGGAPVLSDRPEWTARLAKGEEILLTHTLEGFNNMPPLGYCMDCEISDFLALIRFMGGDR